MRLSSLCRTVPVHCLCIHSELFLPEPRRGDSVAPSFGGPCPSGDLTVAVCAFKRPHLILLQIEERSVIINVIRRTGRKGKSLWLVQSSRTGAILRVSLWCDWDFVCTVHLSRLGNEWWLTLGASTLLVFGLVPRYVCVCVGKCGRFYEPKQRDPP